MLMLQIKGEPCAPGLGIGILVRSVINKSGPPEYIGLEQARERSIRQVRQHYQYALGLIGEESAKIFRVYEAMLQDDALFAPIQEKIRQGENPETAVHSEMCRLAGWFASQPLEAMSRRADDFTYLKEMLTEQLLNFNEPALPQMAEPMILCCQTFNPGIMLKSMTGTLAGILLNQGGRTSHAVILARARGIPVICGISHLDDLPEGCLAAMDANAGDVWVEPSAEVIRALLDQKDRADRNKVVPNNGSLPDRVKTADGLHLDIGINVDCETDLRMIRSAGGARIGLLRTENFFSSLPAFPDERQQVDAYRLAIEAGNGRAVLRLFDFGSDKKLPYFHLPDEENPVMGIRGIRLLLEHPAVLRAQLRALLIAGASTKLSILIPMIRDPEDCLEVRSIIEQEKDLLVKAGQACCEQIQLGAMVETPAAAILIDRIVMCVDFICIGTNDLAGYVMVADRSNPAMIRLYDQAHPAVLRLIHSVVECCTKIGIPCSVCGEIAGDPDCTGLLIGLGVRSLSMPMFSLAEVSLQISSINVASEYDRACKALQLNSSGQVRQLIACR